MLDWCGAGSSKSIPDFNGNWLDPAGTYASEIQLLECVQKIIINMMQV